MGNNLSVDLNNLGNQHHHRNNRSSFGGLPIHKDNQPRNSILQWQKQHFDNQAPQQQRSFRIPYPQVQFIDLYPQQQQKQEQQKRKVQKVQPQNQHYQQKQQAQQQAQLQGQRQQQQKQQAQQQAQIQGQHRQQQQRQQQQQQQQRPQQQPAQPQNQHPQQHRQQQQQQAQLQNQHQQQRQQAQPQNQHPQQHRQQQQQQHQVQLQNQHRQQQQQQQQQQKQQQQQQQQHQVQLQNQHFQQEQQKKQQQQQQQYQLQAQLLNQYKHQCQQLQQYQQQLEQKNQLQAQLVNQYKYEFQQLQLKQQKQTQFQNQYPHQQLEKVPSLLLEPPASKFFWDKNNGASEKCLLEDEDEDEDEVELEIDEETDVDAEVKITNHQGNQQKGQARHPIPKKDSLELFSKKRYVIGDNWLDFLLKKDQDQPQQQDGRWIFLEGWYKRRCLIKDYSGDELCRKTTFEDTPKQKIIEIREYKTDYYREEIGVRYKIDINVEYTKDKYAVQEGTPAPVGAKWLAFILNNGNLGQNQQRKWSRYIDGWFVRDCSIEDYEGYEYFKRTIKGDKELQTYKHDFVDENGTNYCASIEIETRY